MYFNTRLNDKQNPWRSVDEYSTELQALSTLLQTTIPGIQANISNLQGNVADSNAQQENYYGKTISNFENSQDIDNFAVRLVKDAVADDTHIYVQDIIGLDIGSEYFITNYIYTEKVWIKDIETDMTYRMTENNPLGVYKVSLMSNQITTICSARFTTITGIASVDPEIGFYTAEFALVGTVNKDQSFTGTATFQVDNDTIVVVPVATEVRISYDNSDLTSCYVTVQFNDKKARSIKTIVGGVTATKATSFRFISEASQSTQASFTDYNLQHTYVSNDADISYLVKTNLSLIESKYYQYQPSEHYQELSISSKFSNSGKCYIGSSEFNTNAAVTDIGYKFYKFIGRKYSTTNNLEVIYDDNVTIADFPAHILMHADADAVYTKSIDTNLQTKVSKTSLHNLTTIQVHRKIKEQASNINLSNIIYKAQADSESVTIVSGDTKITSDIPYTKLKMLYQDNGQLVWVIIDNPQYSYVKNTETVTLTSEQYSSLSFSRNSNGTLNKIYYTENGEKYDVTCNNTVDDYYYVKDVMEGNQPKWEFLQEACETSAYAIVVRSMFVSGVNGSSTYKNTIKIYEFGVDYIVKSFIGDQKIGTLYTTYANTLEPIASAAVYLTSYKSNVDSNTGIYISTTQPLSQKILLRCMPSIRPYIYTVTLTPHFIGTDCYIILDKRNYVNIKCTNKSSYTINSTGVTKTFTPSIVLKNNIPEEQDGVGLGLLTTDNDWQVVYKVTHTAMFTAENIAARTYKIVCEIQVNIYMLHDVVESVSAVPTTTSMMNSEKKSRTYYHYIDYVNFAGETARSKITKTCEHLDLRTMTLTVTDGDQLITLPQVRQTLPTTTKVFNWIYLPDWHGIIFNKKFNSDTVNVQATFTYNVGKEQFWKLSLNNSSTKLSADETVTKATFEPSVHDSQRLKVKIELSAQTKSTMIFGQYPENIVQHSLLKDNLNMDDFICLKSSEYFTSNHWHKDKYKDQTIEIGDDFSITLARAAKYIKNPYTNSWSPVVRPESMLDGTGQFVNLFEIIDADDNIRSNLGRIKNSNKMPIVKDGIIDELALSSLTKDDFVVTYKWTTYYGYSCKKVDLVSVNDTTDIEAGEYNVNIENKELTLYRPEGSSQYMMTLYLVKFTDVPTIIREIVNENRGYFKKELKISAEVVCTETRYQNTCSINVGTLGTNLLYKASQNFAGTSAEPATATDNVLIGNHPYEITVIYDSEAEPNPDTGVIEPYNVVIKNYYDTNEAALVDIHTAKSVYFTWNESTDTVSQSQNAQNKLYQQLYFYSHPGGDYTKDEKNPTGKDESNQDVTGSGNAAITRDATINDIKLSFTVNDGLLTVTVSRALPTSVNQSAIDSKHHTYSYPYVRSNVTWNTSTAISKLIYQWT